MTSSNEGLPMLIFICDNPPVHMKRTIVVLLLAITRCGFAQLSLDSAKQASLELHMSAYSYHEQFIGHAGYGAPLILTADGGAAAFGDGDEGPMLVKWDKDGKVQWKRAIAPKGEEMELQSVVQATSGNYYVCFLVYDNAKTNYRGGVERIAYINNKTGAIVWEKYIGTFSSINNPVISYLHALPDGRIELRGHVARKAPPEGKDPTYLYWQGWIGSKGNLTQKDGVVIDWKKTEEWQARYKPEN